MTMQRVKSYVFVAAMAVVRRVVRQRRARRPVARLPGDRAVARLARRVDAGRVHRHAAVRRHHQCHDSRRLQHHESLPDDLQRPRTGHLADAAEGHRHGRLLPRRRPNNEITVTPVSRRRTAARTAGTRPASTCRYAFDGGGDRDDSIGRHADARFRARASHRQEGTAACAAGLESDDHRHDRGSQLLRPRSGRKRGQR